MEKWLGSETPFPERKSEERRYELAGDYLKLFNDVLDYCRKLSSQVSSGLHSNACAIGRRLRFYAVCCRVPAAAAAVLDARADRMADLAAEDETQTPSTGPIVRKCWTLSPMKRLAMTHEPVPPGGRGSGMQRLGAPAPATLSGSRAEFLGRSEG